MWRLIRNMYSSSSSAWDFFIILSSISFIFLFSKCKASSRKFICLFVPTFFFTWRSLESPSLNSSLLLSLIETFVEAIFCSKFRVLPRTDSSAAGTFDSVGRAIITAFTNDIVVKYCHFIHMWSLQLGQILYRLAFSVLSNTYLSTFPTSFALVYLKETLFRYWLLQTFTT